MTYNVFSGTLNPTHFTLPSRLHPSPLLSVDSMDCYKKTYDAVKYGEEGNFVTSI